MMAQLDTRQLLKSVAKLIETPDVRALELSLIATLKEIISAKAIRFCHIHENPEVPRQKVVVYIDLSDAKILENEKYEAVPLESDKALLECLEKKQIVVDTQAKTGIRVIHPIKGASGIFGFLVIECEKNNPHDQELVSILLGFYKNYVSLLNDNQRDKLTGLLNRKTFDEKVLRIIASQRSSPVRASDGRGDYCLAILDIDHFKRVNDKFGHLYGDEVLLLFAQAMIDAFRGGDLLFRIGGEEFVVVLKDVDLNRALLVLERFRQTVEDSRFPQVGKITTSIGASLVTGADLPATVIDRADQALYYAKSNGRNQACAYENLIIEGKLKISKDESNAELF